MPGVRRGAGCRVGAAGIKANRCGWMGDEMRNIESQTKDEGFASCQCVRCVDACRVRTGWFLPGEAEKAAELKGMILADFFKQYLGVDWWSDDTLILAPAIRGMFTGGRYPEDPEGTCVFLVDGKCDIHDAKPFECRAYIHTETSEEVQARHRTVVDAWRAEQHQKQCRELEDC